MGSQKTKRRMKLEQIDLIALVDKYSLDQMAIKFKVSKYMVSVVLSQQLKTKVTKKIDEREEKKKLDIKLLRARNEVEEYSLNCNDEWNKLKQTDLYKGLINK